MPSTNTFIFGVGCKGLGEMGRNTRLLTPFLALFFSVQLHAEPIPFETSGGPRVYIDYSEINNSRIDTLNAVTRDITVDGADTKSVGYSDLELQDSDGDGVLDIDDNCPETSGVRPVDECGCDVDVCPPSPIPDGYCAPDRYLRFFDIVFDFDAQALTPHSNNQLARLAGEMLRDRNAFLTLIGHTDSTGTNAYNLGLGGRRGEAAAKVLKRYGVGKERFQTVSMGESWPAYTNDFDTGRANNRRDDMSLGWMSVPKVKLPNRYVRVADCGLVRTACKPIQDGLKTDVALGEVLVFEDGKALTADSMADLRRLAHLMHERIDIHLVISGRDYDWKTLQVLKRLLIKGVDPMRVHVVPNSVGVAAKNVVSVKVLAAAPLMHRPVKLYLK